VAIPAAPLESGGDKILFSIDDNAGTNRANVFRGYRQSTLNSENTAAIGVYDVSGALRNGNRQLTSSTALQLSTTSIPAQWVSIKARSANAGTLYVGTSTVTADTTEATGGYPLDPGETVAVPCGNLNQVYIRGTSGDGIAYVASID
jgi:hypothetical protein